MVFGMSLPAFTMLHVIMSLIGIASGGVVLFAMFGSKRLSGWTALFLATTILTSATGFLFPATKLLPSHIVGTLSLVVLGVTVFALYSRDLAGRWRWIYVSGAVLALYLNVFVAVVQAFQKVPLLKRVAPTQTEWPFIVAQTLVLLIFVVLFLGAVCAFRPPPVSSR